MTDFYAGAYWGAREESSGECAERLLSCLISLAALDPSFSTWYRKGSTEAAASGQPVDTSSRPALTELFLAGQNRGDADHAVITELGFSANLWNRSDGPAAFRVQCGAHSTNPAIRNVFLLDCPDGVAVKSPRAVAFSGDSPLTRIFVD